MPTELMRMYFHEASTDPLVSASGITIAEKIVVASTATHIMPTLLAETASSIAKINRLTKTW